MYVFRGSPTIIIPGSNALRLPWVMMEEACYIFFSQTIELHPAPVTPTRTQRACQAPCLHFATLISPWRSIRWPPTIFTPSRNALRLPRVKKEETRRPQIKLHGIGYDSELNPGVAASFRTCSSPEWEGTKPTSSLWLARPRENHTTVVEAPPAGPRQ